ncbi:galactose oxidase early set domain-containing protein [Hymenobacter sp. M29]|uniref:Galactose oxidase early set domain-containing protein n=1 Tax=Hymenobacter mellowenesis TaxID=3063995 RepID=A0ABT9AFD0_9BACT|nr:galactose oxidase early set domain-containing protein [Hymenobacter sp. M29]MDO7848565.1 galactose oxidase early set domain-containing protein [Hymenobacter sp. M29]
MAPVGDYAYVDREAGTAVMYAPGKILVIGGGGPATAATPTGVTNTVERIDLNAGTTAQFQYDAPMQFARFHVNGTILPDGTVLVTGGIPNIGKNDLDAILPAELWTPPASGSGPGTWTTLNPMSEPRLYHSTAVLLPDGRVLSAGGGGGAEYTDHPTAEIFSPPYLFKGARPRISGAPTHVGYGQAFTVVATPGSGTVARVTLVRLSSVTHSFNMNQRFLELPITTNTVAGGTASVAVAAPGSNNDCPPGHYLLFVLNSNGVPSEGQVVQVDGNPCSSLAVGIANAPTGDCATLATATATGPNLGTDFKWTINGVYEADYDGFSSVTLEINPCQPQVTFGVRVTPSCGGSPVENFASAGRYFVPNKCPCINP